MAGPNTALGARASVTLAAAAVLCLGTLGCDGATRGLSPGAATSLLATRAGHFTEFDRWARRAMVADSARRDRRGLEETIFAPIRRDSEVVSARVERQGLAAIALSRHADWAPPPSLRFSVVRDERLGEVEVARGMMPDPRRRDAPELKVLVLRRTRRAQEAEVVVTLAYVIDDGAETP